MGSGKSSGGGRSNLSKDVSYCMTKHTLNLDGSRGAYGDAEVVKCVIDRQIDRAATDVSNQHTYESKESRERRYASMGLDRNGSTKHVCRGDRR